MRAILWFLGLVILAVSLALLAQLNPGNVVVFVPPYRVDLSLNLCLLGLALIFGLSYIGLRALGTLRRLPQQAKIWRQTRHAQQAAVAMRAALQAFYEGRFAKAERMAQQAAQQAEWTALANILSARAAQRMQEFARAEQALNALHAKGDPKTHPESNAGVAQFRTAVLMTRAEMQLDQRNPEAALESIDELNRRGARHIAALRVAVRAHQLAGNWREVLRHLRILAKREALHPVALQQMRLNAYRKLLLEEQTNPEGLLALWRSFPAVERQHPGVAAAAARSLLAAQLPLAAAHALEDALNVEWDAELIRLYAACASADMAANRHLLEQAEKWQQHHPSDAALLATLGKLCLHVQLWGKARGYLAHALKLAPRADTHLALAHLAEATEDATSAAQHYKAAAELALEQ